MNTKGICLIFVLYLVNHIALAQSFEYPKGAYMSWEEVKTKSPSQQFNVIITEREYMDLVTNGGNDYKILPADSTIKRKVLRKEVWAISDGENLYINGFHFEIQSWYAKAEHFGQIILFKGALPNDEAASTYATLGLAPAFVLAEKRCVYRLGKNSGRTQKLDKKAIEKDLANDPELLAQYQAEEKPRSLDTIMKYAVIINSKPRL